MYNAAPGWPAGGRESPKFYAGDTGRYAVQQRHHNAGAADAGRGREGGLRAGARAVVGRRMRPVAGAMGCAGFCCAAAGLGGARRGVCGCHGALTVVRRRDGCAAWHGHGDDWRAKRGRDAGRIGWLACPIGRVGDGWTQSVLLAVVRSAGTCWAVARLTTHATVVVHRGEVYTAGAPVPGVAVS